MLLKKNKTARIIADFLSYMFVMINVCVVKILPLKLVLRMGKIFGTIAYYMAKEHRKVGYDSLRTALGKSVDEPKTVIKKCFNLMGETLFEAVYYSIRKIDPTEHIQVIGQENLINALEKGKGVVCVTAHMGNFAVMMYGLQRYGYKTHTMLRPLKNKYVNKLVAGFMEGRQVHPIFSYPRNVT